MVNPMFIYPCKTDDLSHISISMHFHANLMVSPLLVYHANLRVSPVLEFPHKFDALWKHLCLHKVSYNKASFVRNFASVTLVFYKIMHFGY